MEIIFLLGCIQAFFFATLFYSRKEIALPHKVLIAFFILNGLILLDHYFELKRIIFDYPHLLGLTYTLPIALGPLLFYYTLVMTAEKRPDFRLFLFSHGIPFILLTLYFLFDYYFLPAHEKLEYYYRESGDETSMAVYIAEFFLNFSVPVYAVVSLLHLKKYVRKIKSKFSYTENINLRWLTVILWFYTGISIVMLITNLFSDIIPVFSFLVGDTLIYSAFVFGVFGIGYYGIKQKVIFIESTTRVAGTEDLTQKGRYQKSSLTVTENDPNLERLFKLMEKEKVYLNSQLSLKELAGRMNFTENNLSQLINEGLGKNFYDFVNAYRVAEVKQKIKKREYAHLTLFGIAQECGFNSKSSFNSIFKQHTGITPSEFKKSSF
jgi:AraC-like DNA-binding protein